MAQPGSEMDGPLAIVCAGGSIPFAVADAAAVAGRGVVLFAIKGVSDPARVERYRHHWVGLGQFGRLVRLAREEGCRDMTFIGTLRRPSLWRLGLDIAALRRLPALIAAFRGGDDHLLRGIGALFEREGFRIIGAHDVAPQVLMPDGVLTRREPSPSDYDDIVRALQALRAVGHLDLAQAIVVADGDVLAVEDSRGTDAMLAQVAKARGPSPRARSGVLVKAPKPAQDRRFDLPAVGPQTIESASAAGLAGIAVVAGGGVVAELTRMVAAANEAGMFIVGAADPA